MLIICIKLEQLERLRSEDTPAASWLPIPLSHIGSQVKRRQSQSYKLKKFAKISNFWILKRALHATHLLKLLDKMCKYEMDPMSIVEDTERTRFCPQTDRRTDGQTGKVIPVYPPINFVEAGGIKISKTCSTYFKITATVPTGQWVKITFPFTNLDCELSHWLSCGSQCYNLAKGHI